MRMRPIKSILFFLGLLLLGARANAFMTVEIYSLTVNAHAMPNLNLPQIVKGNGFGYLPFYLRVNLLAGTTTNWAVEMYSDNTRNLQGITPAGGIYRGLRGTSVTTETIPIYWQAYPYDQGVAATWGTPVSVTMTVGGLNFSEETLGRWGLIFDRSDADRAGVWTANRSERAVTTTDRLGAFPSEGRERPDPWTFIYFGADMRNIATSQDFSGTLVLDLLQYPFDYSKGGYATPNPVKPVWGQKVYFNFYTNDPHSQPVIKIYDPTGYPVITLHNTRYWNCRNNSGHLVEGGLYIYQIEVEGHLISGTVVVIK